MYGLVRVSVAIPKVSVADCTTNIEQIENLVLQANAKGAAFIVFPELSITGASCKDLFLQQLLVESAEQGLLRLVEFSQNIEITIIVGLPIFHRGMLLDCAAVIQSGKIYGIVPKTYIPNYGGKEDARWFASSINLPENDSINIYGQQVPIGQQLLFDNGNITFGIEIGEDMNAPLSPGASHCLHGAQVVFNLSATADAVGAYTDLKKKISVATHTNKSGYVYVGAGYGESTQDAVYSGYGIVAENGRILAEVPRFKHEGQIAMTEIDVEKLKLIRLNNTTLRSATRQCEAASAKYRLVELPPILSIDEDFSITRKINPLPFIPIKELQEDSYNEIISIQSMALMKRLEHTKAETLIVGISGGLDSTLALLVAVNTMDLLGRERRNIIGVTMPGFGTTDRTYTNALELMRRLGISMREVDIKAACEQHFLDIHLNPQLKDAAYENSQARERTQILMDIANMLKGIVLGTGDLSELALGWATYNGDHMSMYNINGSIPKTLIRELVSYIASTLDDKEVQHILNDIVDTPISPELIPADENGEIQQKTENIVGPYELHDFFIYHTLKYSFRPAKVFRLAQKAFDGSDPRVAKYDDVTILQWLKTFYHRFFAQQFKRSCSPDGPKVGSISLSPRGDWHMPSDAICTQWVKECESLEQIVAPTIINETIEIE